MAISKKRIDNFVNLMRNRNSCSYNMDNKQKFHKEGKAVCREIAKLMGLEKDEYDIRSNMGGIAVSGEVTLHTDGVYFQLSQSVIEGLEILYRGCEGRKDYTGKTNQWMKFVDLRNLGKVAKTLRNLHDKSSAVSK